MLYVRLKSDETCDKERASFSSVSTLFRALRHFRTMPSDSHPSSTFRTIATAFMTRGRGRVSPENHFLTASELFLYSSPNFSSSVSRSHFCFPRYASVGQCGWSSHARSSREANAESRMILAILRVLFSTIC